MIHKPGSIVTAALAYVLIACAVLTVFTLAYGIHQHGAAHCCPLCHFRQIPYVEATPVPRVPPPAAREDRPVWKQAGITVEPVALSMFSRAPPLR